MSEILEVRNPHSILAALRSRPRDVQDIHLPVESDDAWKEIQRLAQRSNIKCASGPVERGNRVGGGRTASGFARVRPRASLPIEQLFGADQTKGLWLALDQVQDPQNVGAIFRTAAFFGIKGVVTLKDRAAPLTAAAYDVACGGMESVPFSEVGNLQHAFDIAKEAGLWIVGTSEHEKTSLSTLKSDRAWLLVVGNEERGLRRLTLESCDVRVGIPPAASAEVTSLNVSVATAVAIAHLSR